MEAMFHTLQEFMAYTKGVIYLVIIAILLGMWAFWNFLVERDED